MSINKRLINTGVAAPAPFDPLQNFETVTYTGNGSTQKITGYIRKGGAFNGSSSSIEVSNLDLRNIFDTQGTSGEFSISFWHNSTYNDYGRIIEFSKNFNISYFTLATKKIQFNLVQSNGTSVQFQNSTTFSDNVWYNVSVTYDSANIKVYINGSLDTTQSYDGTIRNFTDSNYQFHTIGSAKSVSSGIFFNYIGKLDQVRIFNKALSSGEVTTLYGETYASSTKSTTDIFGDGSGVALYELDEDANTTPYYPYGTGAIDSGQSAVFNGSSSKITTSITTNNIGVDFNNRLSNFTFSAWFNTTALDSTDRRILSIGEGAPSYRYIGFKKVNSEVRFEWYTGAAGGGVIHPISANTWYNIVGVRESGYLKLYINGSFIGQAEQTVNNSITSSATLTIGAHTPSTNWFNGSIDQVRIYSSALSASDIEALVSETNVPTANLVAHYKLDGNANDETTNYNGTASNITYSDPAEFPLVQYNGTPTNVNFLGMAFQPDLVWVKPRSANYGNIIYDSVRGTNKRLFTYTTIAEVDDSPYALTSFDSNGFTVSDTTSGDYGVNGAAGGLYSGSDGAYVAWCWKAGGAAVSNTDGTITSTVSVNPEAGFSIVKWTADGNGFSSDIGHGLSAAPELIITKDTDSANDWIVTSSLFSNPTRNFLKLNLSDATGTSSVDYYNLNASTFKVGARNLTSGKEIISYAFHSVDGYQKIGSYTGTGASGNVVTTGFQPRWVMTKRTNGTGGNWIIYDSLRVSGTSESILNANLSNSESSYLDFIDFNTNGFTLKDGFESRNGLNDTYIYLAIA
jgi:hypothetical protein